MLPVGPTGGMPIGLVDIAFSGPSALLRRLEAWGKAVRAGRGLYPISADNGMILLSIFHMTGRAGSSVGLNLRATIPAGQTLAPPAATMTPK